MNLPNALTILRIFFVPFLVAVMVEQDLRIEWRGEVLVSNAFLALSIFFTSLGFAMAAAPAFETATALLTPPSDAETLTLFTPSSDTHAAIDSHILAHPFTQSLLANPSYTASRPHLKIPPSLRPHRCSVRAPSRCPKSRRPRRRVRSTPRCRSRS